MCAFAWLYIYVYIVRNIWIVIYTYAYLCQVYVIIYTYACIIACKYVCLPIHLNFHMYRYIFHKFTMCIFISMYIDINIGFFRHTCFCACTNECIDIHVTIFLCQHMHVCRCVNVYVLPYGQTDIWMMSVYCIFMCVYVHIHVQMVCVHAWMYISQWSLFVCFHVQTHRDIKIPHKIPWEPEKFCPPYCSRESCCCEGLKVF